MKNTVTLQNEIQKLRRPSLPLILLSVVMLFLVFPAFAQELPRTYPDPLALATALTEAEALRTATLEPARYLEAVD